MKISQASYRRMLFLSLFLVGLFSLLFLQFFKIQWIEGEKWKKQANRQHYFVVREPFRRGVFLSRDSVPLVFEVQKFHLYVDPLSIPETHRKEIADRLITYLDLSLQRQGRCRRQFYLKSRSRKVEMWLDPEKKEEIESWWYPFARKHKIARNALYFVSDYKRSYPFGKLLGPVLHTVQNVRDEKTKEAFPTGGLELTLHPYLKGKEGKRLLMRSPKNALEMGEVITEPKNGATVTLTVNHHIQAIMEEELEKGVKKFKAKGGWAVMMEPKSGEILGLAQYPFFDPTCYRDYFNDPELMGATKLHPVTDAHEIGSVMKPFTALIGFLANEELERRGEKPLFDPDAKMPVSDPKFPGRRKPLKDITTRKFVNLNMAIQKSSNIYFARLVQRIIERLGDAWYREALQQIFGFGTKTGIELPAESPGLLPRLGKLHPNGRPEWSKSTPYSLAIGHNIQMTSLQLMRAYCLLANRGKRVHPTLIRAIEDEEKGKILLGRDLWPEETGLNPEKIERVIEAMRFVSGYRGSAPTGNVPRYTQAGKTGTPNKVLNGRYCEKLYCPNFIGFVPAKDPAFVLLVTLDEPKYGRNEAGQKNHMGGTCCPPIFREIAKRSLPILAIPPDDPYNLPSGDPRRDSKKSSYGKKIAELNALYDEWNL